MIPKATRSTDDREMGWPRVDATFFALIFDDGIKCEYIRIMKKKAPAKAGLSRRETQIMDIVYAARECSAVDVRQAMSDPPSYSTVRKLLTILVDKGHLKHREEGGKYFYRPTKTPGTAGRFPALRVKASLIQRSTSHTTWLASFHTRGYWVRRYRC